MYTFPTLFNPHVWETFFYASLAFLYDNFAWYGLPFKILPLDFVYTDIYLYREIQKNIKNLHTLANEFETFEMNACYGRSMQISCYDVGYTWLEC